VTKYPDSHWDSFMGQWFGRLMPFRWRRDYRYVLVDCLCMCGTIAENIRFHNILRKTTPTRSCGCIHREICTPFLPHGRGPDNHNWKGGRKSERHRLMERKEYKEWRTAVFKRDNYTCQKCGIRGGTLCAHHIFSWEIAPEARYEVSNGVTLCVGCHNPSFYTHLMARGHTNADSV
jgi:5-methylcytosine-specific restriction endonuclease McrA